MFRFTQDIAAKKTNMDKENDKESDKKSENGESDSLLQSKCVVNI